MITVAVVAAYVYKNLGVSNTDIAIHTGLMYLPWTIKPLWAPLTEIFKTKRHWVLATEFLMALTLAGVAFSINLPSYMSYTLAFFWVTGFLSSTQDIAADGVYISVTTPKEQSAWVGIQGICWNGGRIVASGALVWLTGYMFDARVADAINADLTRAAKAVVTTPMAVPEELAEEAKKISAVKDGEKLEPHQIRVAQELGNVAKDWGQPKELSQLQQTQVQQAATEALSAGKKDELAKTISDKAVELSKAEVKRQEGTRPAYQAYLCFETLGCKTFKHLEISDKQRVAIKLGTQDVLAAPGVVVAPELSTKITQRALELSKVQTLSQSQLGAVDALNAVAISAWKLSWTLVMFIIGGLMALLGFYHLKMLPQDPKSSNAPVGVGGALSTFGDTITTFFQKPGIWGGIAFILLYRSGEGFIEKIGPLFMIDAVSKGGLGLSNQALGNINGIFGTVGFMAGALLGGMFAAKMTLKRSIIILAIAMNVPHLCYNILAHTHAPSLTFVTSMITIEKFGYGFGSVAHMLYMMHQIAPGKYKTAHYAFATSLMGLGLMIPSMMSGAIQENLGYPKFFMFVLVASIPSVIAAWLAPFPNKEEPESATRGSDGQKPSAEAA